MAYKMIGLEDYATFNTIEELDENVKHFNRQLKKTHYETLNLLKQYSLKIIGVSHLKIERIARELKKSRRTIENHIKYLKENGFITVVNTTRDKKGGKGANAYIINTIEYRKKYLKNNNCVSKVAYRNEHKKRIQSQQAQAFGYVKVKKETIESLNYLKPNKKSTENYVDNGDNDKNLRICPNGVPNHIYNQMRPFFTDEKIQQIYLSVKKDMKFFSKSHTTEEIDEIIEISINSLLNAKRDYKINKRATDIYNPIAYVSSSAWHRAVNVELGHDIDDYVEVLQFEGGYQALYE